MTTLRRAGERFGFAVESVSLVAERHQSRPSPSRRPISAPASMPATWWPPPRRWAVRIVSKALWSAATGAAAGLVSRLPTSPAHVLSHSC